MSGSGGKLPKGPSSASTGFSSTPLKSGSCRGKDGQEAVGREDGILSDDEDTFSLLSPIYHDSFESEEEEGDLELSPTEEASPRQSPGSGLSLSPVRCELPKRPFEQMHLSAMQPAASPALSPWELWLVNKAKEERLNLEKKAEEEGLLKEKKEEEKRKRQQKKIVMEEKIQEWLTMKREQEKHEQLVKQCQEEEEMRRRLEKQREVEQKAQQKYRDWLQKKNREKVEKEKKEKEDAALKEEQEKERHKKAEEKFKEWVAVANEKSRRVPKSPCCPTSPYDKSYPSPSFFNPIPWKPIHTPPPETSGNKTSGTKSQKQRKNQQSTRLAYRLSASGAQTLPGR